MFGSYNTQNMFGSYTPQLLMIHTCFVHT